MSQFLHSLIIPLGKPHTSARSAWLTGCVGCLLARTRALKAQGYPSMCPPRWSDVRRCWWQIQVDVLITIYWINVSESLAIVSVTLIYPSFSPDSSRRMLLTDNFFWIFVGLKCNGNLTSMFPSHKSFKRSFLQHVTYKTPCFFGTPLDLYLGTGSVPFWCYLVGKNSLYLYLIQGQFLLVTLGNGPTSPSA